MFNGFSQAAEAAACVIILMAYIITGIWIAPNVSRYKTDSNKRAMMCTCPPSSASTAESCSRPRQRNRPAAETAARRAACSATPGPRATPHSEALALHTRSGHVNY